MSLSISSATPDRNLPPLYPPPIKPQQSNVGTLSRIGKFLRNNPGKILAVTAIFAGAALALQSRQENSVAEDTSSFATDSLQDQTPLENLSLSTQESIQENRPYCATMLSSASEMIPSQSSLLKFTSGMLLSISLNWYNQMKNMILVRNQINTLQNQINTLPEFPFTSDYQVVVKVVRKGTQVVDLALSNNFRRYILGIKAGVVQLRNLIGER